jgi:hypothetical protein
MFGLKMPKVSAEFATPEAKKTKLLWATMCNGRPVKTAAA